MATPRKPIAERRQELVVAALDLLADMPLDKLSTRRLAARIGVSQPALFRHFRSRDALLTAVVDHARSSLAQIAGRALDSSPALEALRCLTKDLFQHVDQFPGIPRLLFLDVATSDTSPHHLSLRLMVSMQRALVTELVRKAQAEGKVPSLVEPERAAHLYLSLVQGTLLQWQHGGRRSCLADEAEELLSLWLTGLTHGVPARRLRSAEEVPHTTRTLLKTLDVRPLIAAGEDPLRTILSTLDCVEPGGLLEIVAPFQPTPLIHLLGSKGHDVEVEDIGSGAWRVWIRVAGKSEWHDLRDLDSPEPLERILKASASLAPPLVLLAALPMFPSLLLPRLEERGLHWEALPGVAGGGLLAVCRPASPDSATGDA